MPPIEVKKSAFGKLHVSYACPYCSERLRSPLTDAGKSDSCPNCHAHFFVPGTLELQQEIQREKDESIKKHAEAKHKYEAAQREKQRKQQEQEALNEARRTAEEQKRRQRRKEAAEQQIELPRAETISEPVAPKKRNNTVILFFVIAVVSFLGVSTIYSLSTKSGAGVTDVFRSSGLRTKLKTCPSYGVVIADAYYDGVISTDVVVFDLLDGGSSTARRIDPVHLLLQFSNKLDLYLVQQVVLARNGIKKFTISSSALRPLAESYANGGRPWAFNNMPSSVCTISGTRAFNEWSGGWLGVMQKQAKDLNEFIEAWTGY